MMNNSDSLERLEKRAAKARVSKVSCMNNSKWSKLFKAVADSGISISGERVKTLGEQNTYSFSLHTGMDSAKGYTDDGRYPPVALKDIEWIFVPDICEKKRLNRDELLSSRYISNDIYSLRQLIDSLGIYEYELSEEGLTIYGYR